MCLLTLVRPLNQGWVSIPGDQAWKQTSRSKLVQSQLLLVVTIHCLLSSVRKVLFHNFLGSTVIKNLPAKCRRTQVWILGKIPHAKEPLSFEPDKFYWPLGGCVTPTVPEPRRLMVPITRKKPVAMRCYGHGKNY